MCYKNQCQYTMTDHRGLKLVLYGLFQNADQTRATIIWIKLQQWKQKIVNDTHNKVS